MKNKHLWYVFMILILGLVVVSAGCSADSNQEQQATTPVVTQTLDEENFIGMPNPASFYCQEMGYTLKMVEEDEGTVGMCTFPDGTQCEEWEFLEGRCGQEFSYCERQGYQLEIQGGEAQCIFPDGSTCPEYEHFTQECQPPGE